MDPADLPALLTPIARGEADYEKADRFRTLPLARTIPPARLLGGQPFSRATSRAIGFPVSDSKCSYIGARAAGVRAARPRRPRPRYGYPNDLLSQLALRGQRIAEAPVRAVYADEISRLSLRHVPRVAALVARAWVRRVRLERAR